MWDSPLHCIFSLPWELHEAVWFIILYIAHFALRNNNNKFPKIEVGGGPETKHFIGVALTVAAEHNTWLSFSISARRTRPLQLGGQIAAFKGVCSSASAVHRLPLHVRTIRMRNTFEYRNFSNSTYT